MLRFNDFEAINEKAGDSVPERITRLIGAFTRKEDGISVDPWPEIVYKGDSSDQYLGMRMYMKDILFRITWKEGRTEKIIIDVWRNHGGSLKMPYMSIIGSYELFLMIIPNLIEMIKELANGKRGQGDMEFPGPSVRSMRVSEAKQNNPTPNIVPAPPEYTDDSVQPQSDFDKTSFNVFDELRTMVIMIINNVNPSLIVTGRGGIGKTHTVMSTLEEFDLEKDDEYVVIKGASTALSMYKALYFNNEKLIIFDDCDSIFKDPDGVNILKGALDSYDEREISWLSRSTYDPDTQSPTESKPVPNRFIFDGRIIFISNLPMEKIDAAIRTRSYTIDINLTRDEIFDIMEKSLPNILPNVDLATKKEVFEYMKHEYKETEEAVNVRTLIKAIKIRLSGAPNWKLLAAKYA